MVHHLWEDLVVVIMDLKAIFANNYMNQEELIPINQRSSTNINNLYHSIIRTGIIDDEETLKQAQGEAQVESNKLSELTIWRNDPATVKFFQQMEAKRDALVVEHMAAVLNDKTISFNRIHEAAILTKILLYNGKFE
jgi:hypothetical protein